MRMTVTYPDIQQGSTGEIVIQLQDFLVHAGSNIRIDGVFGLGTRNAVRAFQKKHKLPVTGIVNDKTWIKLLEVSGNIKVNQKIEKKLTVQIPDLTEKEAKTLLEKYKKAKVVKTRI